MYNKLKYYNSYHKSKFKNNIFKINIINRIESNFKNNKKNIKFNKIIISNYFIKKEKNLFNLLQRNNRLKTLLYTKKDKFIFENFSLFFLGGYSSFTSPYYKLFLKKTINLPFKNIVYFKAYSAANYSVMYPIFSRTCERRQFTYANNFIYKLFNNYLVLLQKKKFSYTSVYSWWSSKILSIPFCSFTNSSYNIKLYTLNSLFLALISNINLAFKQYNKKILFNFKDFIYIIKTYKKRFKKKWKKTYKKIRFNYYTYNLRFITKRERIIRWLYNYDRYLKIFKIKKYLSLPNSTNYKTWRVIASRRLNKLYRTKRLIREDRFEYKRNILPFIKRQSLKKLSTVSLNSNNKSLGITSSYNNNKIKIFTKRGVVKKKNFKAKKKFLPKKTGISLIISNSRSNFFFSLVNTKTGGLLRLLSSGKLPEFYTTREKRSTPAFELLCVYLNYYLKSYYLKNNKHLSLDYIKFIFNFNIVRAKLNYKLLQSFRKKLKKYKIKIRRFFIIIKRPHSLGARQAKPRRK